MIYSMTATDPRYLGWAPPPGSIPITPRSSISQRELCDGHQFLVRGSSTQERLLDNCPAAVTTSPGVEVCLPPFNQAPGRTTSSLVTASGHIPSPSLINGDVISPTHAANENLNKGNWLPTSLQLNQSYQGNLTSSNSGKPIDWQGVGVDQFTSHHQCNMCSARYTQLSGLNRHYKEKHMPWMSCRHCNFRFSSGRMYNFTKHLQTCPGAWVVASMQLRG